MRSRPINAVRKRLCSNDSETVTPLVLSYSKAPLKRKGTYAAGTFSASAGRTSATTWGFVALMIVRARRVEPPAFG